ncbi:MAG: DUF6515 family protein [Steroidobacteraceae bacterium]
MSALLAAALAGPAANLAFAQGHDDHDHHGFNRGAVEHHAVRGPAGRQFFDNRYNHGRYYPSRGAVVRVLPGGYRSFYYGGRPFFFVGGVWYASGPGGFIVTEPPRGLVVSVLPPFYTTVWLGGVPYYYADDVYYQWDPGADAYQIVDPPAGADQPGQPVQTPPVQAPQDELYIYPKNGQTKGQQAQDRYECHSWATQQTGFDPTQPGGGVAPDQNAPKRQQYRRAMTACLNARGYSVD